MVRRKEFHFRDEPEDIRKGIRSIEDDLIRIDKIVSYMSAMRLGFLQELAYPFGLKNMNENHLQKNFFFGRIKSQKKLSVEVEQTQISIRKTFDDEFYLKNSLSFKSGIEYLQFGDKASDFIKPVLYYYGLNHIYSGIINILLKINTPERHGIRIGKKDWEITIEAGFFLKLVILMDYISKSSSFFSKIFWEVPEYPILKDFVLSKKIDLFELNKLFHEKSEKSHIENYQENSELLLHYLNLFYFCSYSRYKPKKWSEFLKGTHYMYKVYVNSIQDIGKHINLIFDGLFKGISRIQKQQSYLFSTKKTNVSKI